MSIRTRTLILPAAAAVAALLVTAVSTPAQARRGRAVKKLALQRFNVGPRELSVLSTAKATDRGGAALVRVQASAAPDCYLLILDAAPRSATKVLKSIHLPVCAAYDKDARAAKVTRVQVTSYRSAYRVSVLSRRVDAMAKGVETRRLWGLYADMGDGPRAIFERTSTTFKSKTNKAINLAEVCEAPKLAMGDEPSTLSLSCKTESMNGKYVKRKNTTFHYRWRGGRFELQ